MLPKAFGLTVSQVSSQAQAEQWLQQGNQAYGANQLPAAISAWEQALTIYRDLGNREATMAVLENLAIAYVDLNQHDKVVLVLQQSLALAQEIGDRARESRDLENLGTAYDLLGQYESAIETLNQALIVAREIDNRSAQNGILVKLALAHYALGDYAQVVEAYQMALPIALELDNRTQVGEILLNLGQVFARLGQPEQAIESYQQALAIQRDLGDRLSEGTVLHNLGQLYSDLGQYANSLDFHETQLALAREIGDIPAEVSALLSIGTVYGALSQYERAIEASEQGLALSRTLDDRTLEASALGGLGATYYRQGQYDQALELQQQALQLSRELGARQLEMALLGNLGSVYLALSQFQQSIDVQQQALTISRELGNRHDEGNILGNLGGVYAAMAQYEQAIDSFQQSLTLAGESQNRLGEAIAVGNLGLVYRTLGKYDWASGFFQAAIAINQEIGNREAESLYLNHLGTTYYLWGQYEQAIVYQQQALEIGRTIGHKQQEAASLSDLGNTYCAIGRCEQAIALYEQALTISQTIGERSIESSVLSNLGRAYHELTQYEQAISFYQQSLTLSEAIDNRSGMSIALNSLGHTFYQLEQPEMAIVFLKSSVEVREGIRSGLQTLSTDLQQSYTDTIAGSYRFLADLLLQQDRIIEAQQVLDLLKVQEIEQYFQDEQRASVSLDGVVFLRPEEEILASLGEMRTSAIAAGQELAALQALDASQLTTAQTRRIAELDSLLSQINADFRNFSRDPQIRALLDQLSYEAREASINLGELDSLRDELQQLNAAIIYPLVLEDRLELIITTPNSPPLRRTVAVSREDLNQAILTFRERLVRVNPTVENAAQQLYTWLLAPLEADLVQAGVDTIIYAPDGQLRYVPLSALHDGEQWLAQRYKVHNIVARSLADLTESDDSTTPRILAAAFADPNLTYSPQVNGRDYTFSGLPGAGAEVAALPATTRYIDRDFSLAAVKPEFYQYNILHFATHATFVSGAPEDSFILFGNGDTANLRDVESWSLNNIDLVVLSACETGVGGLGTGEEILGLGYQFQLSGARSVMASLWKVSDTGTQALMTTFYASLAQGMSKAEALQAAQVALIESTDGEQNYSHPYYWAPFILIGNGL
jgi:CHAT domain-containing protein/tetratricopeptide (TPR) repeat protein